MNSNNPVLGVRNSIRRNSTGHRAPIQLGWFQAQVLNPRPSAPPVLPGWQASRLALIPHTWARPDLLRGNVGWCSPFLQVAPDAGGPLGDHRASPGQLFPTRGQFCEMCAQGLH